MVLQLGLSAAPLPLAVKISLKCSSEYSSLIDQLTCLVFPCGDWFFCLINVRALLSSCVQTYSFNELFCGVGFCSELDKGNSCFPIHCFNLGVSIFQRGLAIPTTSSVIRYHLSSEMTSCSSFLLILLWLCLWTGHPPAAFPESGCSFPTRPSFAFHLHAWKLHTSCKFLPGCYDLDIILFTLP